MTLTIALRLLVIAFAAGVAGWLPFGLYVFIESISSESAAPYDGIAMRAFGVAMLGAYAIGLPVAFLTFLFSAKQLVAMPSAIFLTANLAGVVLIITSFALAGEMGIFMLGVPSLIAANAFAALAYLWIIRPQRLNSKTV